MLFEELLFETLVADAALNNLIGGRVFATVLERANPLPALTVQTISDNPEITHGGDSGLTLMRVQFTVFAKCHLDCLRVLYRLDQMFTAFRGGIGTSQNATVVTKKAGNRQPLPRDAGSDLYACAQDFMFYYSRSL